MMDMKAYTEEVEKIAKTWAEKNRSASDRELRRRQAGARAIAIPSVGVGTALLGQDIYRFAKGLESTKAYKAWPAANLAALGLALGVVDRGAISELRRRKAGGRRE